VNFREPDEGEDDRMVELGKTDEVLKPQKRLIWNNREKWNWK